MLESPEFFETSFPDAKMPSHLNRSWAALKNSKRHTEPILDALDLLNVKYESPGWRKEAIAHIIIPKKKIALGLNTDHTNHVHVTRAEEWRKIGWVYTRVFHQKFKGRTTSDIAEIFRGMLF